MTALAPGGVDASAVYVGSSLAASAVYLGGTQIWTPPAPSTSVFDNFKRPDSATDLGANWTNQAGAWGIDAGCAYPVGGWDEATWITPMASDDMTVSFTLGSLPVAGNDFSGVMLGVDNTGLCAMLVLLQPNTVAIYSQGAWGTSGAVPRATQGFAWSAGQKWSLQRVGNLYSVLLNGASFGLTWTDDTDVVPRDASHRLVGLIGEGNGSEYRRVAAFAAS